MRVNDLASAVIRCLIASHHVIGRVDTLRLMICKLKLLAEGIIGFVENGIGNVTREIFLDQMLRRIVGRMRIEAVDRKQPRLVRF